MNTKRPLPTIVIFAIFTVITTVVWIAFDVYRTLTKEASPDVPPGVLQALDPTLDQNILDQITDRVYLPDSEIGDTELINIEVSGTQPVEETGETSGVVAEPAEEETLQQETGVPTEEDI